MPLSRHDALPVVDRVKLAVEIYTAPIQLQVFFKIFDADFVKDSLVEFIIHILRFRSGLRNVKIQPRDEFQTIRRTSEFFQTPLDVRHQTNAFFLGVHVDEVAVRYLRSEVTAVFRLPGREQDWVALRRTRHIQWPFDRQIFALVVEDMNASGIEILTRLLILENRVIGQAVPKALANFNEQIGRASCRERVCKYVSITVVAGSINKKIQKNKQM